MIDDWATEQLKRVVPMKVRRDLAWMRIAARRLTARFRPLPNVLIIGAQRCGTSSLYKYLGRHPQVKASIRKETQYFTTYADRGESWYRAHFPLSGPFNGQVQVYFEASPDYMLDPRCAERAAAAIAEARVIALLRDPVARAFSQYQHNRRLGNEPLTFEEALDAEDARLEPHRELIRRDPAVAIPKEYARFSYVTRGLYAEQLERWIESLTASRVLVITSDELFHDSARAFQKVTAFLQLSGWTPTEFRNYSYEGGRRRAEPVDKLAPLTRARLEERFREPNRRLEALLGREMDW